MAYYNFHFDALLYYLCLKFTSVNSAANSTNVLRMINDWIKIKVTLKEILQNKTPKSLIFA